MRRKLMLLVLLTGCAATEGIKPESFTYTAPDGKTQTVSIGAVTQMLVQGTDKLVDCIFAAKGDFKKVVPCLRATPTPVPNMSGTEYKVIEK